MNKFDIFADSSANIPEELVQKHDINVISYLCTVNGVERPCYEKGVDFKEVAKKFYDEMRAGADTKTSLVDEQCIVDAVTPTLQAGRDAVFITIASGISGTHHQALAAKKQLEEKFPKNKLYVCDSANASMGQGLLVLKAAELREAGKSAKDTAKWVDDNAYRMNSYVTVDDLKYLKKSGRVSTLAALVGSILNIRPILWANDTTPAKLEVCGKERGRKKAISTIIQAFKDNVIDPENQTIAIAHADCEEDALHIAEAVKELGAKDVIIEYYDLCTGAHAGPGTVALFFFGKDRKSK